MIRSIELVREQGMPPFKCYRTFIAAACGDAACPIILMGRGSSLTNRRSYLAGMDSLTAHAMALDMPGTAVKEHFGRPSYSVKKKTYLTVWPHENRAVLKLTLHQQAAFGEAHPDAFAPIDSKLDKHGWTAVSMDHVGERLFRYAMDLAWRNVAPKWLILTRQAPPGQ